MKAVEIGLIQSQHDTLLSVARRLHQENVFEKTHNRRINADNFENINKGIPAESPVSNYLLPKKEFPKILRQIWIKEQERILVISFNDNDYLFLQFLAPLHIRYLGRANTVKKQIVLELYYRESVSCRIFPYY
jgi:hypothetical protein